MRNMNKCLFVKMGLNKGKVKSRICLAKYVFHEVWKDLFLMFLGSSLHCCGLVLPWQPSGAKGLSLTSYNAN